ncbi:MAG: carboxypeptidase-like regulatory domain-containing protein [Candidatus Solibacter sp.]|jgi:hypothetical protein
MIARFLLTCCMMAALSGQIGGPALAQSATAHIAGKIVDESGKVIASAQIRYQRLPLIVKDLHGRWQEAPGEAHVSSAVSTGADGTYAATQLPAGNCLLCVNAPGYLASCDWAASHRAAITDGQQLDFGTIALAKAATVTIRLDDPLHLVQSAAKLAPPLALGIVGYGRKFHPAQQVASDSTGRTFQVDVPYGTPLNVWFQSPAYRIADSAGAQLNSSGALLPFQVAQNAAPPTFTLRVTGTLP